MFKPQETTGKMLCDLKSDIVTAETFKASTVIFPCMEMTYRLYISYANKFTCALGAFYIELAWLASLPKLPVMRGSCSVCEKRLSFT